MEHILETIGMSRTMGLFYFPHIVYVDGFQVIKPEIPKALEIFKRPSG